MPKLQARSGTFSDQFGHSVAITVTDSFVGAIGGSSSALSAGAVYVFELRGTIGVETAKLMVNEPGVGDSFGESVDFAAGNIVAGAVLNGPWPAMPSGW